jgi:hypothetical protein
MARPTKIVQQKLEDKALQGRSQGLSAQATADSLNEILRRRGSSETISQKAVERYFARRDRASIAPPHQPQNAEQNAALAINVGADLQQLATVVSGWFAEAEQARRTVLPDATDENQSPEPIDLGPDWQVRLSAAREFRETLKFAADVLERIYNAEQIQVFQAAVMKCVAAADPVVASEIRRRLSERQEMVRAHLLGV